MPICDGLSLDSLAAAPPPQKIEIRHYSHQLTIAAPVVSSAAVLALSVRIDAFKDDSNLPHIPDLPLTRSDAVTQGWDGASVEDIHDFHLNIMIPVRRRPLLVQDDLRYDIGDEDESEVEFACNESGSGRCDEDWYRLVACHDPHISDTPLRGVLYHPGSMTGRWAGRLMVSQFVCPSSPGYLFLPSYQISVSTIRYSIHRLIQEQSPCDSIHYIGNSKSTTAYSRMNHCHLALTRTSVKTFSTPGYLKECSSITSM